MDDPHRKGAPSGSGPVYAFATFGRMKEIMMGGSSEENSPPSKSQYLTGTNNLDRTPEFMKDWDLDLKGLEEFARKIAVSNDDNTRADFSGSPDPSKNSFKKIISFQAKNEKNSIEIVDRPRAVPLHEPQSTRQYVQDFEDMKCAEAYIQFVKKLYQSNCSLVDQQCSDCAVLCGNRQKHGKNHFPKQCLFSHPYFCQLCFLNKCPICEATT